MQRVTDHDRQALQHLTTEWRMTPPCFSPNALCRDQQARGLIEIGAREGRFYLRLTPIGAELMACQGEA